MRAKLYLAEWRQKRGLSQQRLADAVGVQQVTVSRIETGRQRTLRLDLLGALARALDVEPWELLRPPKR